jgi:hypothetical protein
MTNPKFLTAAFVLALAALPSCKKLEKLEQAASSAAAAVQVPGKETPGAGAQDDGAGDADAKLGEKLSKYIDCFNSFSDSVHSSYNRYFDWIDEKKGITGKERNVYGLYKIDPQYCLKNLDDAKKLEPSLPDVETAAEAYRAAANDLNPLVAAAYKYYDQEDYKDDKFAKGKEMHGPLVDAFKKFFAADDALSAKVVPLNESLSERRLAALAKDPNNKLQYLIEKSVADAKKLMAVSTPKTLNDLDEAKFNAALETYDTSVTNLDTFATANKAETDKVMMFSSFLSDEQNLVKAAKALGRRKREKKDFNKEFFSSSSPQMVDGHPAQIIEKFNTVIRDKNNLSWH